MRAAGLSLLKASNGQVESRSVSFPVRGSKRKLPWMLIYYLHPGHGNVNRKER